MPTVEIDEAEFLRNNKLRETVAAILANPEAKLKVQEATKLVFPSAVTPELDAAKNATTHKSAIEQDLAKLREELAADRTKREDEQRIARLTNEFESGFDRLRKQGWTTAGIDAVKKIMEEKGIFDHDIAAAYYEKQNPPQNPVTPNGRGAWNFQAMADPASDQAKLLNGLLESKGNNENLVDKLASDALQDFRNAGR